MKVPPGLLPRPLRVKELDIGHRRRVYAATVLMAVGLLVALVPPAWLRWAGTTLSDDEPLGPMLVGALGLALLAGAARLLWLGVADGRGSRGMCFGLGLAAAVLCGNSARSFLELAGLRHGWRPGLVVSEPLRALPLLWVWLAGVIHLGGYLLGLTAMVSAILPSRHRSDESDHRALHRSIGHLVSWVPAAELAVFVVGSLVLTRPLLLALDSIVPNATGHPSAVTIEGIFTGVWTQVAALAILQFAIGCWSGVELARLSHDVIPTSIDERRRRTVTTILVISAILAVGCSALLARNDFWPGITLDPDSALDFFMGLVIDHDHVVRAYPLQVISAVAVGLAITVAVMIVGEVGPEFASEESTRATPSSRLLDRLIAKAHSVTPEMWAMAPLALIIFFGIAFTFAWTYAGAVSAPVRFPLEASRYYDYWEISYLIPHYSTLTVSEVVGPGLELIVLVGLFACIFDGARNAGATAAALAASALVLLPSLDDVRVILLLYVTFLVGTIIYVRFVEETPDWHPAALRVGFVSLLLVLFAVVPDAPAAALLAGTIVLRLVWQAGALNRKDPDQGRRLYLALGSMLLLCGITVASTPDWFAGSNQLGSIGHSVALPLIAMPFALGFFVWSRPREPV